MDPVTWGAYFLLVAFGLVVSIRYIYARRRDRKRDQELRAYLQRHYQARKTNGQPDP